MKKQFVVKWIGLVIGLVAVGLLFMLPLDYYIKKPGDAYRAAEYIKVENKDENDQGEFRFTTVAVMKATPFFYVLANFLPYQDVEEIGDVLQEEEDEEEYEIRQLKLMDNSQFNAISVAFQKAKLPYTVRYDGIYVLNIISGSAADGLLKPGDEIVEIDGVVVENLEQLGKRIDELGENDNLELVIKRNKKLLTKELTLKEIPKSNGKIGLGITYTESKSIQTEPFVKLNTEDIGGPSAGLMFTLEILNQLLDEDLTKGYVIAGTGTMNEDGSVGRIGGIDKKVVAAERAGAAYFLAPDDDISEAVKKEYPDMLSNYEEALEAVKKLDTTMEVVPIKTIDDALEFLKSLQPKN